MWPFELDCQTPLEVEHVFVQVGKKGLNLIWIPVLVQIEFLIGIRRAGVDWKRVLKENFDFL